MSFKPRKLRQKFWVNQRGSLSQIKTSLRPRFSLCFASELLVSFRIYETRMPSGFINIGSP